MKKTIGGDRLGSGKKMQVDLHGYERSTHDLGYLWRSTMSAGTLVPFMSELALPGDTFDINLDCDIKTHPTIGPLFGSYKVQLDVFQAPIRLYNSWLHNNMLGIGLNMKNVKLPILKLTATDVSTAKDIDNAQINPSCILSYLGIRGVGIPNGLNNVRDFNAVPFLSYWDIYKNYYANKQEEIGAVIHVSTAALVQTISSITHASLTIPKEPSTGLVYVQTNASVTITYSGTKPKLDQIVFKMTDGYMVGSDVLEETSSNATTITCLLRLDMIREQDFLAWNYIQPTEIRQGAPVVQTFPLSNIDDMRSAILSANGGVAFDVKAEAIAPYIWVLDSSGGVQNMLNSQEGLAIKTYQSDLFNNWLQTEWIDGASGIAAITAIDTTAGSFTIDTLNLANKVYQMLNRIAISGGTYDDWLDAVYTEDRYKRASTPMYMGGLIKELVFQEVVSNAGSETSEAMQPLGTLAGRGVMSKKHKGGKVTIKVDEPSYIIGIISLTPRVDYSQGNKWDVHLKTLDDIHKPGLDEIGFQELITEQMAWWDTKGATQLGIWNQKSAGKQPAWINYMTNVNVVRGNFAIADNEMFMTLNRRYEKDANGIKDLTTYIDPSKFNFIFAQTSMDAQNFWAQVAVDITARRKMSAKVMPNL